MPTLIMGKLRDDIDPAFRAKSMAFFQKLTADDTVAGLHIEPIHNSIDPRVRTGRVDDGLRAVLFRLDQGGERFYVVHGVFPHDDAIRIAGRAKLTLNPVNGLPQFEEIEPPSTAPIVPVQAPTSDAAVPLLMQYGITEAALVDQLGLSEIVAAKALLCSTEDAVLELAAEYEGWLGTMLVSLAAGDSVDQVAEQLQLQSPTSSGDGDRDILESLQQPAALTQFTFIENQDELRRVIEGGDLAAWRVFLHPEQRKYATQPYTGPFRLSGGAGTGKTVVIVHRARMLATRTPTPRIIVTTFTTNLAHSVREQLAQLDPEMPVAGKLGQPGAFAAGIDALASAVIRSAGAGVDDAAVDVLGETRSAINGRAPSDRWRSAVESTTSELNPEIANETFLAAEYGLIVLPNRIHTEDEYLRVRRPGRGTRLSRAARVQVWQLITAYRTQNRVDGALDFAEAAAVAAAYLDAHPDERPADHVLVDEGQDLSASHWLLIRALVAAGADDLFIAEDAHQRIYGARTVLGRFGIRIVGRSRRLSLTYRTTRQNLRYALTVLAGEEYTDLEDQPESTPYRSARSGPAPALVTSSSMAGELDRIEEAVSAWLSKGARPETIAVLVRTGYHRDRIVQRLNERGIDARAVDREAGPTDRVQVLTMHRAKGMEFPRVVLSVGVRSNAEKERLRTMDDSERADAASRARSLEYVAATRARDELVVIISGS